MMTAEFKAWAQILRQPIQNRRSMGGLGSLGMTSFLLLVALAAVVGGAAMHPSRERAFVVAWGAGIPLSMLCLMWWIYLLRSIAEQCRPVTGRLVPRLRERARNVTVAVWCAIVVVMLLVFALPLGHPWHVAAVAGLALLHLNGAFVIYWFLGVFGSTLGLPIATWMEMIWNSDAAAAAGLVLVAFELRRFVRRMFGVSPHLAQTTQTPPLEAMIRRGFAWVDRTAGLFVSKSGMRADDRPLFVRVLGGQGDSVPRFELAVLTVVCAALAGWNAYQGKDAHAELHFVRAAIVIVLLGVQLLVASSMLTSFASRIQEQGLVRLAAGAPNAAEMNRILARHFLARQAKMWGAYAALSMAALLVLGATLDEALRALAVCAFALPLLGIPLADHARAVKPLSPVVGVAAVGVGICAFLAVWGKGSMTTWSVVALATVCAAAAFVGIRWTRMVRAAPAFPARRA
ncbi:hypothetical protein Q4S45_01515 [Massilia sp. R2A-15]|uniref:hypothetical protein n=1 Tax=Massilia sp. R2A-15 TaxID=3064278 RepID=UPI0027348579|nr:hypothetical protein [Massilia sp. R2A-15]WLI89827.1 hypothetical protein Q4S45_01515 [Massilia sp. R2A-15]